MSVGVTERMKETLYKKCETQEQPIKKNKIAIEESDNGYSEPSDNDSNETETEDEMKTGAEDDVFLDVMSIDMSTLIVGDWVDVQFCTT
jgi:hypothetical protein